MTSDEQSSAIVLFIALISVNAAVFVLSLQFGGILGVRFTLVLDAVLLRSESLKFGKQSTENTRFDNTFTQE
jgi:hypothetical protein